ncbi:hypothetical protein P7K49_014658 [Saguinus oedipus]|uniref:Uncharacterized protein n=1 Tax=Saguinus oedipus TaxID=9490 RepID=A0ABQ9V889_SAGOE|nr:hypothetical protein P7K49_014658 [Saguinus oedipus]
MEVNTALQGVLKTTLIHDGPARGIRRVPRALEEHQAHLCMPVSAVMSVCVFSWGRPMCSTPDQLNQEVKYRQVTERMEFVTLEILTTKKPAEHSSAMKEASKASFSAFGWSHDIATETVSAGKGPQQLSYAVRCSLNAVSFDLKAVILTVGLSHFCKSSH